MPEFVSKNAIVLNAKPIGEAAFILSIFTAEHGRHLGVLKKKHPPEIGTLVQATWKARLSEQIGIFYLEETKAYAPLFLDDINRLHLLANLCATLEKALPERQSYTALHTQTLDFLASLAGENAHQNYVQFELNLLEALGFALDMSACAGGGDKNDLAYISPKSGRAVSRQMGLPYHDKLLKLPRFLWQEAEATLEDLCDGLNLTGYFLREHLGQMPNARTHLFTDIQRRKNG